MKIALVCSQGGHLTEILFLMDAFKGHDTFFITYTNVRTNQLEYKKYLIEEIFGSKARVKILKTLAKNSELTISLIINKTKLNYSNVMKHLNHLKNLDLIQEKKFGRIKIYRYKIENIKARSLKKFIDVWEDDFH